MDFHWNGDQLTEEIPVNQDGTPDYDNSIRWIYEPGSFTPVARYEKGQLHYAVTDTVGRIQELLTENGTIVWRGKQQLWGREESISKEDAPSCRLRFPGQYEDEESGLYYNRFRYYDCETGQYLCADPVGLNGGINPYSYVQNPLKWIDPLGLCKEDFFAGTEYTDKVLAQMKSGDLHSFPESVLAFQDAGTVTKLTGGDSVVRDILKIPGQYRGKDGMFEFIKEPDGKINHRLFKTNTGQ